MSQFKNSILACLLGVLMIFVAGCDKNNSDDQVADKATNGISKATLDNEARLQAALHITNESMRDESLVGVAKNAAENGDGKVALIAITGIQNTSRREIVARDTAISLARNGDRASAVEAAKLIDNQGLRDKTYQEIAK